MRVNMEVGVLVQRFNTPNGWNDSGAELTAYLADLIGVARRVSAYGEVSAISTCAEGSALFAAA